MWRWTCTARLCFTSFGRSAPCHRALSSSAGSGVVEKSNRKKWKEIVIDPRVLQTIENLKLGKATRRQRRTNVSEKKPSPLPLTRSIQFVAGAKQQSSIPPASYLGNAIQIAFAGRSNVGKSSLLNALLEKRISRVSEKPGQTQQILWFRVHLRHDHPTVHAALRARNFNTDNDPEMLLLDFPGYGFAYAKEQVQEKWKETMYTALANGMVKMLWLLIDARHGLKSSDREFVQLLVHTKTPFRVVLTKSDLVFPEELARRYQHTCEQLRECGAPGAVKRGVVMVSTRTGAGVRNLQRLLCETIGQKRARQKKQGDEWLAGRK